MSLAGGVVGEHDVAGLESSLDAVACLDLPGPDIVTRYWRRGAGCRSRTVPGGTQRKTAMVAGRESVVRIF